jgi:ABC-type multidrug transport system fused ATPase/permease subunit
MIQMSTLKDKSYTKVRSNSTAESVTSQFSIEDDDDMDEISFESHHNMTDHATSNDGGSSMKLGGVYGCIKLVWSTLTFSWMEPLLTVGNQRPLEKEDLFKLQYRDSADGVYKKFKAGWSRQLQRKNAVPSITWTFLDAFGTPFLLSGLLKLINDSCMFVGPLLLNRIIHFLNDPHQPLRLGLSYVFGLFAANLLMSLCLRQYFWWCYRVGMNLRTSIVTAVYHKSLAISAASLSRKTLGEITNLMSVDSSRLQDLTPYLHALWYSLFQIVVAMFLLWQQVGVSCISGFFFIVVTIPITRRMSMHMKTLQKSLSSLRDERIKLTNEVLNGMKVIKLQAWEAELQHRVQDVRERELAVFRTYSISQCLSGVLYTTIPLLVSISTFATYIALGHQLDVATALTSLALFDLLRFPLFMLPQVLNNVVEARVSVDRIQSYLLEPEKVPVHSHPLKGPGILMKKATLVWDSALKRRAVEVEDGLPAAPTTIRERIGSCFSVGLALISCNYLGDRNAFSTYSRMSGGSVDASIRSRSNSTSSMTSESSSTTSRSTTSATQSKPQSVAKPEPLSEEEIQRIVTEARIIEAERTIDELEHELSILKGNQQQQVVEEEGGVVDPANGEDFVIDVGSSAGLAGRDVRTLTLSRISVLCAPGQLVSIVGPVGSGKSSMLSALLGDMRYLLLYSIWFDDETRR